MGMTLFVNALSAAYEGRINRPPAPVMPLPTPVPTPRPTPRPTVSPAPTPFTNGEVTVQSTLSFRFFRGTALTDPTQAELVGLVTQIERFYTDLLSPAYTNFLSFSAQAWYADFDPAASFPVAVNFDGVALFSLRKAIQLWSLEFVWFHTFSSLFIACVTETRIPSAAELFVTMSASVERYDRKFAVAILVMGAIPLRHERT